MPDKMPNYFEMLVDRLEKHWPEVVAGDELISAICHGYVPPVSSAAAGKSREPETGLQMALLHLEHCLDAIKGMSGGYPNLASGEAEVAIDLIRAAIRSLPPPSVEEGGGLREALLASRASFLAIQKATIEGKVCDDVAWFSEIETLHDYCASAVEFIDKSVARSELTALRKAGEAVAWRWEWREGDRWMPALHTSKPEHFLSGFTEEECERMGFRNLTPLYAHPPAVPEGWRDISTAPKDGTWMALWAPDYFPDEEPRPAIGRWNETVAAWDTDVATMEDGPASFPDHCNGPTHWMPLPSPPYKG